jgi:hypothetical protein
MTIPLTAHTGRTHPNADHEYILATPGHAWVCKHPIHLTYNHWSTDQRGRGAGGHRENPPPVSRALGLKKVRRVRRSGRGL